MIDFLGPNFKSVIFEEENVFLKLIWFAIAQWKMIILD